MKEKKVYKYEDIDFILQNEELQLPDDYISSMNENWKEEILKGRGYINGSIYTISGYNFDDMKKQIYIQRTLYSHYLYSKKRKYDIYSCRSMASNALFLTSDNYFVLGKMQNTTSLPGKIKFIGGSVEREDISTLNRVDITKCIRRECNEEIGINIDNEIYVEDLKPIAYITRTHLTFLNTLFFVKLLINKKELENHFKKFKNNLIQNNKEVEIQDIILVHNDEISIYDFLEKNDENLIDYMKDFFETYFNRIEYGDFEEYVKNNIKKVEVENEN